MKQVHVLESILDNLQSFTRSLLRVEHSWSRSRPKLVTLLKDDEIDFRMADICTWMSNKHPNLGDLKTEKAKHGCS